MTWTLRVFSVLIAVGAATVIGCSSDSKSDDGGNQDGGGSSGTGGSTSTGGTGGSGACSGNAPPECCDVELPVMVVRDSNDALVPPDWSCIQGGGAAGTPGAGGSGGTAGAGGAAGGAGGAGGSGPEPHRFAVEDFGGSGLVVDVEVELYDGNGVVDKTPFITKWTKGPANPYPDDMGLNNGEFFYDPPPALSVLSYRVTEKPGVAKRFVGFNYPLVPPPGRNDGATVSPALYNQLATFAVPLPNWSPPEDLAIMAAPIRDCSENDVGNALFRFLDASGNELPAGEGERDIRYIYFDGSYPNPKCNHTDFRQALVLVANAKTNAEGPTKGETLTLEFLGRVSQSDTEPKVFARQDVEIFENSVNVYNILPNVQQ